MSILITGGAGYIGSHCCVAFLDAGFDVVVVDNLVTGNAQCIDKIANITGRRPVFEKADIRDQARLEAIMKAHDCQAVVHFAGLKVLAESLKKPLHYYDNNVGGTISLVSAMSACGVKRLIFSSSASVYGAPQTLPVREDHPLTPANPYGRSKLMIEDILRDLGRSDPDWRIGILRYFNPTGAHKSGLIGEDPSSETGSLMPFVARVAAGKLDALTVFGGDYDTPDGTGVRDFIHVVDLADGHLQAHSVLEGLSGDQNCFCVNVGTGTGYSVLDLVKAFEGVSNRKIPYKIALRRDGDVPSCFADTGEAADLLGWSAQYGLEDMCRDTWNWVCKNPFGYRVP